MKMNVNEISMTELITDVINTNLKNASNGRSQGIQRATFRDVNAWE